MVHLLQPYGVTYEEFGEKCILAFKKCSIPYHFCVNNVNFRGKL